MSQLFNPSDAPFNGANSNGSPSGQPLGGWANGGSNGMSSNGASLNGAGASGFDGRGAPSGALPAGAPGRELDRFAPAPPPAAYPRTPMGGDEDDETVDVSRYWRALKRRRGLVLKTFGTVLGLGILWTALQKPVYQSSPALILVSTPGGGSGGAGRNALFNQVLGVAAPSSSLGQQMVIIRSPEVQAGAVKRLDPVTQKQVATFARVDIVPDPTADAINVQVQSRDNAAAAAFANAICREYTTQNEAQNIAQVLAATKQVLKQRDAAKRDLNRANQGLLRFQTKNNTIDIETETTAILGRISTTEDAIRTNDAERLANQASLRGVENQLRRLPDYSPTSIVPTNRVQKLKDKLTDLSIERTQLSREYRSTSREIRDINSQISDLQEQLKREAQTQIGGLAPNPLRQTALQRQVELQGLIWASEARARALQSDLSQTQAEREQLPSRTNSLNQLKLDQATALSAFQGWNDKYQQLRAQAESRNSNARLWTPATPGGLIAPRRTFNIIASALLGLLLGVALALLLDRLDDRVHGADEAVEAAHLPVLAHVPLVEGGGAALLLSGAGGATQNPAMVESFRMLRANIAFAGLDEPPRVIAVTSSRAGEGKSTSALNLATIMALSGKSVLLVDCDLRRPEVHALLGLPNEVGLTTVAAGMTSLDSTIQETRVPGLRVLTSGPIPPNAPELFDSRGGRAALLAAGQKAEFVVLDCPPALGLADAHLVSHLADATLLVVACDSTNKREVARSGRSLTQAGGRLLGLVLNKMPVKRGENDDYFQLPSLQNGAPRHNGSSSGLVAAPPVVSPDRATSATGSSTSVSQDERGSDNWFPGRKVPGRARLEP